MNCSQLSVLQRSRTSFSRLERDICRRGALFLYWVSNTFDLMILPYLFAQQLCFCYYKNSLVKMMNSSFLKP
jgi:hypothetical protein